MPPPHPGPPTSVSGVSAGVHYSLKVNPGLSFSLPPSKYPPYATVSCDVTPGGGSTSVSYTASIPNGGWAGPYYFHYGSHTDGATSTNWAGNTAGSTPTIQDNADQTNQFLFPGGTYLPELHNEGDITPVWYWTGPDLGEPPPGFTINVSAEAYANDDSNSYDTEDVSDGLGDDPTEIPGGDVSQGSQLFDVTVQSDDYAPEEGDGYWAIGPTIHLYGNIDAPVNETNPYGLTSSLNITAWIFSD
jgi:hypothetical protein